MIRPLLLALAGVSLASCGCTDIGCAVGLSLTVWPAGDAFEPGSYELLVTTPDGLELACAFDVLDPCGSDCIETYECEGGTGFLSPATRTDTTLAEGVGTIVPTTAEVMSVTLFGPGDTETTETVSLEFTRSRPNGPMCGPVCMSHEPIVLEL